MAFPEKRAERIITIRPAFQEIPKSFKLKPKDARQEHKDI